MTNFESSPLISVVVVSYNSADWIEECLNSINEQTYANIELIVTDDHSTDCTTEILNNWVNRNKNRFASLKVVNSPVNTGVSANCNRGLKASTGEWIKFIAADDMLLPQCLEELYMYVCDNPDAKAIFVNSHSFVDTFENNNISCYTDRYGIYRDGISAEDQLKLLLKFNCISACGSFLNRNYLAKLGGFDESIPMVEDIPMWIRITSKGEKLYHIDKTLVGYRIHQNTLTSATVNFKKVNINQLRQYLLISEKYRIPLSTGFSQYYNKVSNSVLKNAIRFYDKNVVLFFLYYKSWRFLSIFRKMCYIIKQFLK